MDNIEKIKSRGYWRVNFRPLNYNPELVFPLGKCLDIITKSHVELRGWHYPHVPHDGRDLKKGNNFYECRTDWETFVEHWRFYQSGQFIGLNGLREDWFENSRNNFGYTQVPNPNECLNVISSLIYELTEIFEFLSRLTQHNIYDNGVEVKISLKNTRGRKLWIGDLRRVDFFMDYICDAESIDYSIVLSSEEASINNRVEAEKAIAFIYERFGYRNYSSQQIQGVQNELYNIRI